MTAYAEQPDVCRKPQLIGGCLKPGLHVLDSGEFCFIIYVRNTYRGIRQKQNGYLLLNSRKHPYDKKPIVQLLSQDPENWVHIIPASPYSLVCIA